jgi:hypothetical protein
MKSGTVYTGACRIYKHTEHSTYDNDNHLKKSQLNKHDTLIYVHALQTAQYDG